MGILDQLMPGAMPAPDAAPPSILDLFTRSEIARRIADQGGVVTPQAVAAQAPPLDTRVMPPSPVVGDAYKAPEPQAEAPAPSLAPQPMPASPITTGSTSRPGFGAQLTPYQQRLANPEPDGMDQLASFLSGAGDRRQGILGRIGGGMQAMRQNEQSQGAMSANYKFLLDKTGDPQLAAAAVANPEVMKSVLGNVFAGKTQVVNNKLVNSRTGEVIADYSDAARQGPEVKEITLADGTKVSATFDRALNKYVPVIGTVGQPDPNAPPVPPGVDPKKWRETLATKMADDRAKAVSSLPEALRNANFLVGKIDDILEDKSLGAVTGMIGGRTPNYRTDSVNAQAKIDQLKGQAFLQAYQSLRGSGAISNQEGAKAERAMARLEQQAVGTKDYVKALKEFRNEVVNLRTLAERKARGDYTPIESDAAPIKDAPRTNDEEAARAANGAEDIRDGTVIRNPRTGQQLIRNGGKWEQYGG